jgi:ATP-citrate lyase alpha-subunit
MSTLEEKIHIINNRRPTTFTSTISDERGDELLYNHIPVSDFVDKGSIAHVIGHLWFKKQLPDYALQFLNTVIILLADHGPAVSGATNTIITARAGKDVVDSLCAGLLTIGPRFGGAVSGAGQYFLSAVQQWQSAQAFVDTMKKSGINIPGIWHKVKSIHNPDKRCTLLFDLAQSFPVRTHLDFAKSVEAITVMKKANLILNVDGHIGAMMLDMMTDIWLSPSEIDMYIAADIFNGLFVLARSIGFIGHHIDQKRLSEWLYRTAWDDILYTD